MSAKEKRPLVYRIWFKILLVFITFLPLYTAQPMDPSQISQAIASVLSNPLANQIDSILIVTKILLLIVLILPFIMDKHGEKVVLGYYVLILIPVSLFQNMGYSDFGFTVIIGNIVIQWLVIIYCLIDLRGHKSILNKHTLDKSKLWLIPLMLLALLMPYDIHNGRIVPSMATIFTNEAGVTYCMITPVIEGLLIIFHQKVHKPTLQLISWVGLIFGLYNMMTWFVLDLNNAWMGVLHLPLLIISIYGLRMSKINRSSQVE